MNDTMRAISQDVLGSPDVLKQIEVPIPSAGAGQVLIRVKAAALNPTDWGHRKIGGLFLPPPPFVLGWDVSGVVEAVGIGVTLHARGDEVFGMLPYPSGHGAFAEYVVGPARAFVPKPSVLSHVQAAAIPLAGLTAWQALVDVAALEPGQRVLIHAAAGGVGHLAVQIAKSRGAYVIGTASTEKHDLLRELGVDEPIDYRTTDVFTAVRDVDVAVDAIGGDTTLRTLQTLRRGGILVSLRALGLENLPGEAARVGVRGVRMLVEHDQTGMRKIAELVETGQLRPVIASILPLGDAAKGHALGATGRTAGKIVLTVD